MFGSRHFGMRNYGRVGGWADKKIPYFLFFFSGERIPFHGRLPLIIFTSSAIFAYPLLKSFNCENRKCKHFMIFSFSTEITGDDISHIRECLATI